MIVTREYKTILGPEGLCLEYELNVREIKNKDIWDLYIDGLIISTRRNQVAQLEFRREETENLVLHLPTFVKVRVSS